MISDKVSALLRAETERKRAQIRNAPTRHQRFGGTYAIKSWVKKAIEKETIGHVTHGGVLGW